MLKYYKQRLWRLCACIKCVRFQKIDVFNIWSLIVVIGMRHTTIRVCLCVCTMFASVWIFVCQQPPISPSQQSQQSIPILACVLLSLTPDTHMQTHTYAYTVRTHIYSTHTPPFSWNPPLHTRVLTTSVAVIWSDWEADLFFKVEPPHHSRNHPNYRTALRRLLEFHYLQ